MRLFKYLISLNKSSNFYQLSRIHYLEFDKSIKKEAFCQKLIENLIYQDENIIAFNKPANAPMYSISYEKLETIRSLENPLWSIKCVKKELLKYFNASYMEEIFSQNNKYSGVIVYALSEKVKDIYSEYFKNIRCQQISSATYTALCVGKFALSNGKKQIALSSQIINDRKMSVSTKILRRGRLNHKIICPTISYKVLEEFCHKQQDTLSLVELKTTSSKWECLQLFCVNELCPIFYDEVYGGRVKCVLQSRILVSPENTKINSQELHASLIEALDLDEMTDSKIPLHLHCSQLTLPLINKRTQSSLLKHVVTIKADLPNFFEETLSRLRSASSSEVPRKEYAL